MNENIPHLISTHNLFIILICLLLLSACFSAAETGIMSINRYRLKYLAKTSKAAYRTLKLLTRPDRLLAIILIGNNFVNISASAIATLIGLRLLGEIGALVATIILTIAILLFSEITPKTLAAIKPEPIALLSSFPLKYLLIVFYPLVLCANALSNGLLYLVGVKSKKNSDNITADELRIVVNEANTLIPTRHQKMLTSILDLEHISVDDIMIPRTEVIGIDLENDTNTILEQIKKTQHTLLPIYRGDIDKIEGIIHMRDLTRTLVKNTFSKNQIINMINKPYFVPEGTPLHTQLFNFQRNKTRLGLVVDEYGDILGLVTLEDILEEIVGEFTTDVSSISQEILPQADGSFLIDGGINIRTLNRTMNWELPTDGAKTLSGAIIEYLETIPTPLTCVLIANYPIEIIKVQDNMIKTCQIFKRL